MYGRLVPQFWKRPGEKCDDEAETERRRKQQGHHCRRPPGHEANDQRDPQKSGADGCIFFCLLASSGEGQSYSRIFPISWKAFVSTQPTRAIYLLQQVSIFEHSCTQYTVLGRCEEVDGASKLELWHLYLKKSRPFTDSMKCIHRTNIFLLRNDVAGLLRQL